MTVRIEIGVQSAIIGESVEYKQWFVRDGWANWLTINQDQANKHLVHLAEVVLAEQEKIRAARQLGDHQEDVPAAS